MEFEKALQLFEEIPFFKDFNREEKRFLASLNCSLIRCKPGEVILRQGEIDRSLFILLQGNVRVTKDHMPEMVLSTLKPGAVFGEISLVARYPRTTNVVADGDVGALKMDGEMIERLNPLLLNKIKNQLIEVLVRRLDEMNDQLMRLTR